MWESIRVSSALCVLAIPAVAQQPVSTPVRARAAPHARAPLTHADYAKWETLGPGTLSPNGRWFAYEVHRGAPLAAGERGSGGSVEVRYRPIGDAGVGGERTIHSASGATFSRNSNWLFYTIHSDTLATNDSGTGGVRRSPGLANAGRAVAGSATPAHNAVGIVNLTSGEVVQLPDVQSFALSSDGAHVALKRYPGPAAGAGDAGSDRQPRGTDVMVRDLASGAELTFGHVAELAWSDSGALLAMTVHVDSGPGSGVQLLDAGTNTLRSLDAANASYTDIVWRPRHNDLAAMRSRTDTAFADTSEVVLVWRDLGSHGGSPAASSRYDFATDPAFPPGMRVAPYRAPLWSDDGTMLFFGIAVREAKPLPMGGSPMPARVEVWHWKDLREYHQQDREAARDRQKTQLVVWHMGANRLIRLADDSIDNVQLSADRSAAIALDEHPYFKEAISGRPYHDVFRVDLATGTRQQIVTKVPYAPELSPDGRQMLYTQHGHWWSYDLATGVRVNLTGSIKSSFVNTEDDHPVPDRRPYSAAAWVAGGKAAILSDRFDLWHVSLNGTSAIRLTRGREDSTAYRAVVFDKDQRWIDPRHPLIVSATGEFSRKSGYGRLTVGQTPERLVWLDKDVSRLEKARDADVYAYQVQTYEESPNYWVGGPSLGEAKRVTDTNPFQSDYLWGKQTLLEYTTARGERLQMMLTYPADYQPGRRYPMVVYYYEKLSQGFHQYVVPTDRATYNTTVFSQEGYFVLRPDIRFRKRDPGYSGLECVTAAVRAALATGMIDPKRVGNMGHSWGGYQSAFYAVHGHGLFAATIAGAPLTDLISMYGYTSFNSGLPETGHYETSQERMEVPLWEDPQAYIRNSTVFAMDSLQTPLLLEEGDADGNVNPWQSMEAYNFGRRLGKQVVYLIYNGENHNVARAESQRDYHKRQLEWFAYYLKGEPAAHWITNGETYLARQNLLERSGVAPVMATAPGATAVPATGGGRGGAGRP